MTNTVISQLDSSILPGGSGDAYRRAKKRAKSALDRAIQSGRIVRKRFCERCPVIEVKTGDIHAHHEDYDKPLDVMWLCHRCHSNRHLEINAMAIHGEVSHG